MKPVIPGRRESSLVAEQRTLLVAERRTTLLVAERRTTPNLVIPAQAGFQRLGGAPWTPAFAAVTMRMHRTAGCRLCLSPS